MLLRVVSIILASMLFGLFGSSAVTYFYGRYKLLELCEQSLFELTGDQGHCALSALFDGIKVDAFDYHFAQTGMQIGKVSAKLMWSDVLQLLTESSLWRSDKVERRRILLSQFWAQENEQKVFIEELRIPAIRTSYGLGISDANVTAEIVFSNENRVLLKAELMSALGSSRQSLAFDASIELEPVGDEGLYNLRLLGGRILVDGQIAELGGSLTRAEVSSSDWNLSIKNLSVESLIKSGWLIGFPMEFQNLILDLDVSRGARDLRILAQNIRGVLSTEIFRQSIEKKLYSQAAEFISRDYPEIKVSNGIVQGLVSQFLDSSFPKEVQIEKGDIQLSAGLSDDSEAVWGLTSHRSHWITRAQSAQTGVVVIEAQHATNEGRRVPIASDQAGEAGGPFKEGWIQIRQGPNEVINLDVAVDLDPVEMGKSPDRLVEISISEQEVQRLTEIWTAKGLFALSELAGVASGNKSDITSRKSEEKLRILENAGKNWLRSFAEKESSSQPETRNEAQEKMRHSEDAIKGAIKDLLGR